MRASFLVALVGGCVALAGCSPLVFLNTAARGNGFSRQAHVAYGTLPRNRVAIRGVCSSWGTRPEPIAAMFALNKQYLRSAGADPRAIAGMIGLSGPHDFLPLKSNTLKKIFGDPPPRTTQPIDFMAADTPPALLTTGSGDKRVDPGNSRRVAAVLTAAGRPVEHRVYPEVGHGRVVAGFSPLLARGVPVTDDVMRFIDSN